MMRFKPLDRGGPDTLDEKTRLAQEDMDRFYSQNYNDWRAGGMQGLFDFRQREQEERLKAEQRKALDRGVRQVFNRFMRNGRDLSGASKALKSLFDDGGDNAT